MKTDTDKVLFISNGYGEDTIAVSIVQALARRMDSSRILAFPLVGEGKAYKNIGIRVVAPTQDMPSGGLIPGGWIKNLWMDFQSGLARLILSQVNTLKELQPSLKMVVAVGDTYPVVMAGLFSGLPVIFVGTAKSDYFCPYSPLEMTAFKRFSPMVFPRDEITAQTLRQHGVNARWVGNAMMDCMEITGERFGMDEKKRVITLLAGSRDFAYRDFPVILSAMKIVEEQTGESFNYLSPLANSTQVNRLGESAEKVGFTYEDYGQEQGITGKIKNDNMEILLLRGYFGDAINLAHIVVGQAGTGNEQAVGLGKPVISFDSDGKKKPGWYRGRQKGLLGDSLSVVTRDPSSVAEEILSILRDRKKYDYMGKTGKERMGPPGGAQQMAEFLFEFINRPVKKEMQKVAG